MVAKYVRRYHSTDQIIGDKDVGVMTRRNASETTFLLSSVEPKSTKEALKDEDWMKTLGEEIEHTKKNETWTLVTRPKEKKYHWNKVGIQK